MFMARGIAELLAFCFNLVLRLGSRESDCANRLTFKKNPFFILVVYTFNGNTFIQWVCQPWVPT